MTHLTSILLAVLLPAGAAVDETGGEGQWQVVKAAKIFTSSERGVIDNGALVHADGRIVAVGRLAELDVPAGAEVVELGDLWLVPGLHEPHCHVAGSLSDLNDMVYLTNPELSAYPVVEAENPFMRDAVAGGVTTSLLIPGSGTNIGGFGALVKSTGESVKESTVRAVGSLKVAQSGNPERYSWRVDRMMMNWNTRDTLTKGMEWARAYQAGEAEFDPRYEGFLGIAEGKVPVSVHTQIYQVVLMTITMQARDLGLPAFIDHGTFDGYKTAALAAKHGVPVMNGPRQFWFDRSTGKIMGCTAEWSKAVPDGLLLGYNTDSPGIPQEELSYQAAMGVRLGHDDPAGALRGITDYAARALLCDDVCGGLEPGLDADLVAWTGFPLDPRSSVRKAWVRGELVYDAEDGRRF